MAVPARDQFYHNHLAPHRILPGSPDFADIGICVICQENSNDAPYDMVALKSCCSHIFHRKCIIGWVESESLQRNACPLCRVPLYEDVPLSSRDIDRLQSAENERMDADLDAFLMDLDSEDAHQLMSNELEDTTSATSAEGVGMAASSHTFGPATPRSPAVHTILPADVRHLPAVAASALDWGETSPAYSILTSAFHSMSPGGVSPRPSPSISSYRPMSPETVAPRTPSPPRSPARRLSILYDLPASPTPYPTRSLSNEPYGSSDTEEMHLVQMRNILSSGVTVVKEIFGVIIVSHIPSLSPSTLYRVSQINGYSERVDGASGYIMMGTTAIFYA